ncbi:hypothetical protein Agub_g15040 [Astrephomene gubernaculifera]|uniref:Uncharacterized protein n=1 Tax=Astrephomene gubernaculifera TaxID=47775 RepID=A0AAD3E6E1_9CHLO|nr:hypothetical protein Agub_g15040 [Astrephomene gubernaculifera]
MKSALRTRSLARHSAAKTASLNALRLVHTKARQRVQPVVCQAVRFPAALPLLPFTAKELLAPGSCKVLRLNDSTTTTTSNISSGSSNSSSSSYALLLEELLSSPHRMLVHTAVDNSGRVAAGSRLGGYEAGGCVFYLSSIVKVIDVKQTDRGVLLRVQSEGRVAVRSLVQTRPYFRAVVVPVTDTVDLDRMQAATWRDICYSVERLRALMRDIQNLAAKFKSPETANLQRSMHWVDNPNPLVFSSSSMLLNSRTTPVYSTSANRTNSSSNSNTATTSSLPSSPIASLEDFQPSKILASQIQPDDFLATESAYGGDIADSMLASAASGSESESDAQYAAAAAAGAEPRASATTTSSSTPSSSSSSPSSSSSSVKSSSTGLPGAAAGNLAAAAAAVLGGGGGGALGGAVIRSRPSLLDLERACRLSLAAIQPLPTATQEEREALLRWQEEALETQDVLQRLQLACRVMGESRALLAAKCALMALSTAG